MQKLSTYRLAIKLLALLLIAGVASPAGLCAGQLMDFSRNSHESATADTHDKHGPVMPDVHDSHAMQTDEECHSSTPEIPDTRKMATHDCENSAGCTCHFDQAPLYDQTRVITTSVQPTDLAVITHIDREVHFDYSRIRFVHSEPYTSPPIFILNSTFLN